MSTNITKEMRLTALVLDGAKKAPDLGRHCALTLAYRSHFDTDRIACVSDWHKFPEQLGFSKLEGYGIMNGWDEAIGAVGVFPQDDSQEYKDAVELGKSLYAMVHDVLAHGINVLI